MPSRGSAAKLRAMWHALLWFAVETPQTFIFAEIVGPSNMLTGEAAADRPPLRVRTSAWTEEFTALKTQADPDGLKLRGRVLREMLGRDV